MAHDLIVVGGGIAGSAAALRAVQYNLRTAWFRGDGDTRRRSRGQWVADIDNMIGIHDGIVRKKIAKLLEGEARKVVEQAPRFEISTRDIIENTLERVLADYAPLVTIADVAAETAARGADRFTVSGGGTTFEAPYVVLATGVMDRQPSIKKQNRRGEMADDPKWVYPFANRESVLYCIRCEGHLTKGTHAAVIGAGEGAAGIAIMLHERYGSTCCVLTNGEAPTWSAREQAILDAYGIVVKTPRIVDLIGGRQAKRAPGDARGGRQDGLAPPLTAKGTDLHTIALEDGGKAEVAFALVAMGLHRVYNELARQLGATLTDPGEPIDERHVQIDRSGETSVPGLFAIGDMVRRADEGVMKQVYTSQEYAVRAVDAIDRRTRAARRKATMGP